MRTKGLTNEQTAKNFVNVQIGINGKKNIESRYVDGNLRLYSYEMEIARWHKGKIYMPVMNAEFGIGASNTTKRHRDLVLWAIYYDKDAYEMYIPNTKNDWYNIGFQTTDSMQYLRFADSDEKHEGMKIWKYKKSAIRNARIMLKYWSTCQNFKNIDVEEAYGGYWRIVLFCEGLK